ncbi:MAG: nicotinate-nucleotide adenylyltransferase [Calditrichaeota bacterium]|nr:nicotinate-nucleotide adenylyltransferase [Calditrichota bacterium]
MRIGLYGGSFNPIHTGHLLISEFVRDEFLLDEVWFIPSATPPHKPKDAVLPAEIRFQLVSLAIQNNPTFRVSDLEIQRGGISYTVDTLRQVRENHRSKDTLFWFIGMDNLVDFPNWHQPEKILELCQLVAVQRKGFSINQVEASLRKRVLFSRAPLIEISSSSIRERIKKGHSIRYFVPDSVREFIKTHHLYQANY